MSLTTAIFAAVAFVAFWAFCSYKAARLIGGVPTDELVWVDKTKFRRAALITAGPVFWFVLFIYAFGSVLAEGEPIYIYGDADSEFSEEERDGGWYD